MEATGLPDHYNILHTLTNKIDDLKTVVEEAIKGSSSVNSVQSRSRSILATSTPVTLTGNYVYDLIHVKTIPLITVSFYSY